MINNSKIYKKRLRINSLTIKNYLTPNQTPKNYLPICKQIHLNSKNQLNPQMRNRKKQISESSVPDSRLSKNHESRIMSSIFTLKSRGPENENLQNLSGIKSHNLNQTNSRRLKKSEAELGKSENLFEKKTKNNRYEEPLENRIRVESEIKNKKVHPPKVSSTQQEQYQKIIFLEKQLSQNNQKSSRSVTKIVKILNIYPKRQNEVKRKRKETAMNRFDFQSENIRLAQKLLSMKPTRNCDKKQHKKFFKKQQYFKQLRSCSIDQDDCQQQVSLISSSFSLPKIQKKYYTIES